MKQDRQRQGGVNVRVGSGSSKGHRLGRRGQEQAILPRASVCPLGDGEPSQEKEKGGLGKKVSKGDPNKRGLSPLANNEPKMERRPIFYSWPRRAINYRFLPPSPAPPPSSCHPRLFWAWAWAWPRLPVIQVPLPAWGGGRLSWLGATGQKPQVHSH